VYSAQCTVHTAHGKGAQGSHQSCITKVDISDRRFERENLSLGADDQPIAVAPRLHHDILRVQVIVHRPRVLLEALQGYTHPRQDGAESRVSLLVEASV